MSRLTRHHCSQVHSRYTTTNCTGNTTNESVILNFSTAKNVDVKEHVDAYLKTLSLNGGEVCLTEFYDAFLKQHVKRIVVQPSEANSTQQEVSSTDNKCD